ncbi:hypothetical protein ESZ36_19170 [Colwellia demingiae]|uniref:Uncharacterized protein n=1 Tax=Colwellia demingiae TaxID=89401 RepID=A0A5C6Q756_9GAMM|nr:hypothetical protein [Colwellia demingiae]TWX64815.1 hypothetical protein ESZ36_19170 [Colwellia demingiae]
MKKVVIIFTGLGVLLSNPSFAHPGHGHSDSGSGLVHLLWLVPVIVAAVVVVFKEITAPKR